MDVDVLIYSTNNLLHKSKKGKYFMHLVHERKLGYLFLSAVRDNEPLDSNVYCKLIARTKLVCCHSN